MSAKDRRLMCMIALKHFKKRKVDISDAIKTIFPFLETLRDHGVITNEKYKAYKKASENQTPVQTMVYEILDKMEEKFHLTVLEILFSKVIMKNYPDLNVIYEDFRHVILKKNPYQANIGEESAEDPNTQLILKQGTGANSYLCLPWLFPDPPNTKGEINAMDISTTSDNDTLQIQQANEQCAQESEPAVTSHVDSAQRKKRKEQPTSSTAGLKRKPESMGSKITPTPGKKTCKKVKSHEESSGANAEKKPPGTGTAAVKSGANEPGPVNLGNSTLQTPKKKEKMEQQSSVSVDFRAQILPVFCGKLKGNLIKRKLEQGATRKSIRSEDGNWFTPREFEVKGGCINSNNWKTSLTCGGKPLKQLIELGFLQLSRKTSENETKEENSNKCTICQDGGKLFSCTTCSRFFHGNCHLPYVATKRTVWNCTFCTIKNSPQIQPRCMESEVLVKPIVPELKLKCEFLLLKVYHQLEGDIFPNIPHENYVRDASRYLKKITVLDTIKKKLMDDKYATVKGFVWAMESFFRDPKFSFLYEIKGEFTKGFKEVFAIQETN